MRDENGRFVKGQSGNPKGRRPKAKELSYLAIVTDVVTPEKFKAGIEKAWQLALRGDLPAMRFVTEYILGKPTQAVSVETSEHSRIMLSWDDADNGDSAAEAASGRPEADKG